MASLRHHACNESVEARLRSFTVGSRRQLLLLSSRSLMRSTPVIRRYRPIAAGLTIAGRPLLAAAGCTVAALILLRMPRAHIALGERPGSSSTFVYCPREDQGSVSSELD